MPKSCSAWNCTARFQRRSNDANRANDITFHSFPLKRQDLLNEWLVAVRRPGFMPTPTSVLCSRHFLQSDYDDRKQRRKLLSDAVPSVFNYPEHIRKTILKHRIRKLPIKKPATLPKANVPKANVLKANVPKANVPKANVPKENFQQFVQLDHPYGKKPHQLKTRDELVEEIHKLRKKLKMALQRARRAERREKRTYIVNFD